MAVWWFVGVVGLLLVGWGIFSARQVLYPERPVTLPPQPLPSYTTHTLHAFDGSSFDVWRLEAPSARARLLVFHGYHANRYQVLGIASRLRDRGYESLLVELRGHGSRPGPCTFGVKEREDAEAVLEWVQGSAPPRGLPLGVLGLSMGAAVACRVALRHPQVRAVVADSAYAHLYPVVKLSVKRRYHLPAFPCAWVTWGTLLVALRQGAGSFDPVAIAPQLRQPLLAIQGGADEVVPASQGDAFYRQWGGAKERWFEPAAAHVEVFSRHPDAYVNRVADFLDQAFQ